MRVAYLAVGLVIGVAPAALAQQPALAPPPGWPSPLPALYTQPPAPPAAPPVAEPPADPLDGRLGTLRGELPTPAPGQQHWVAVNLIAGQPFAARVMVKVLPRENDSIWVEAYGGSALFDGMYGFGVRLQHTVWANDRGSRIMVAPGLGVHVMPDWWYYDQGPPRRRGGYFYDYAGRNPLVYAFGDVDVSWLYDFTPHVGFELGVKVGLAGRLSGRVGADYPRDVMWGKDLYPILAVYSGLRF